MVDLSIIIVSYNTKDILRACLESVFASIDIKKTEVIVVDNASSDTSSEMVKEEFPKTILIQNKTNAGFSKANNIGVKKANGRYILFLNSDTVVNASVFGEMLRFMDNHKDAGAATCKVVLASGNLDDACHRGFPTPWNAFCHFSGLAAILPHTKLFSGYSMGWEDLEKQHEIDALAGAFMWVRKEAGDDVSWWDEDFFWYGDDIDFCYRLKQKGWKVSFVPNVSILHYKGVSGGIKKHSETISTATKETKKIAIDARFSAMEIFYTKHYQEKYPKWLTWLVLRGIAVRKVFS